MDKTVAEERIHQLECIIGTDAGGRGMQHLIVPGDLLAAASCFNDAASAADREDGGGGTTVILSGFPCCVDASPPTETDGPPGTMAIARAALALGHHRVIVVTDDCNRAGFCAAAGHTCALRRVEFETFAAVFSPDDEQRFQAIARDCTLLIACERAGPSRDGNCYTMRGIDMTGRGLIAPLHRFVSECSSTVPFVAIGDGGNELGMGKVIDAIRKHIDRGDVIGCVIPAHHLIAASVSNWGGYALAAAAALVRAQSDIHSSKSSMNHHLPTHAAVDAAAAEDGNESECGIELWLRRCLPTESDERELLDRCVAAGCRDGVSGKLEATVDGMPLETSLQCLRDIGAVALGHTSRSAAP